MTLVQKSLLVVPTSYEMEQFPPPFRHWLAKQPISPLVSGFGLIAAAASLSRFLFSQPNLHAFKDVILLGIAGAYDPSLQLGSALEFDGVACYGIGLGSHSHFQSPSAAGWNFTNPQLGDDYNPIPLAQSRPPNSWLLSCTASANNPHDVELRKTFFPPAIAEDMEAYGIAMVCRWANLPLRIIRGISNHAGDRQLANWKTSDAILAATNLLMHSYPN